MDKFHAFMMRYTLGFGRALSAYCSWAESQAKGQFDLLLLGLGPIFALGLLLSRMGGRLLPFGIGAVIGWTGTRSMAKDVVEGSAALFGPAPSTFGRTIEA